MTDSFKIKYPVVFGRKFNFFLYNPHAIFSLVKILCIDLKMCLLGALAWFLRRRIVGEVNVPKVGTLSLSKGSEDVKIVKSAD